MNYIRNKYIDKFFGNLTETEKKNIYFDNFMWQAFSSGKVLAIEGSEAIKEFKKHTKNNVYIIFQHHDKVLHKENLTYGELLKVIKEDIWDNMDCYVIDKNFEWTFVCTHETFIPNEFDFAIDEERDLNLFPSIGPFFYKNSRKQYN